MEQLEEDMRAMAKPDALPEKLMWEIDPWLCQMEWNNRCLQGMKLWCFSLRAPFSTHRQPRTEFTCATGCQFSPLRGQMHPHPTVVK